MRALSAVIVAALLAAAGASAAPRAPALTVSGTFASGSVLFGDPVTAEVDVHFPAGVDPGSIRLDSSFLPYVATASPSVSRSSGEVRLRYSVSCLGAGCLPDKGAKLLHLPPLRVSALAGGRRLIASARWPVLRVGSRLSAADLRGKIRFRSPKAPPAVDWGIAPGTLVTLLVAAAAVCALGAFALLGLGVRRLARSPRSAPRLSPLELAIAFVRDSTQRPPGDRRRALELLAEAAEPEQPVLAGTAWERAWSRPEPTAAGAVELADRAAGGERA
jgi:hypothetical protein